MPQERKQVHLGSQKYPRLHLLPRPQNSTWRAGSRSLRSAEALPLALLFPHSHWWEGSTSGHGLRQPWPRPQDWAPKGELILTAPNSCLLIPRTSRCSLPRHCQPSRACSLLHHAPHSVSKTQPMSLFSLFQLQTWPLCGHSNSS